MYFDFDNDKHVMEIEEENRYSSNLNINADAMDLALTINNKMFSCLRSPTRVINYVRDSYKLDPVNIECSTNIFVIIMARVYCIMINVGQCIEWFVL